MRILVLLISSLCLHGIIHAQYGFDTLRIYFDIGSFHPHKEGYGMLDSLANSLHQQPRGILIYGYADYLGTEPPNQQLSEKRAASIREYLQEKHIDSRWILTTMGMGQREEMRKGEHGNPFNRRTEILVKRRKPKAIPANPVSQQEPVKPEPTIDLALVKEQETIVLQNINFYESMHQVLSESIPSLQELLEIMRENPTLKIQIEGHICCVTGYPDATDIETGNLDLSFQRAKFVRDYLVKNGIAPERLRYKGLGHTKPLIPVEMTEQDRITNRRVEIRILEK